MPNDITLPGLAPSCASFELERQTDGYWKVKVWTGDAPGFRTEADKIIYVDMTLSEVVDVLDATVSCWRAA